MYAKKAMISQPMNGKTDEEIEYKRSTTIHALNNKGYAVVNTFFDFNHDKLKATGYGNIGLYYLAKSLEAMSACDAVYFCKGWEDARGCRIEHDAAKEYGLELIYEE